SSAKRPSTPVPRTSHANTVGLPVVCWGVVERDVRVRVWASVRGPLIGCSLGRRGPCLSVATANGCYPGCGYKFHANPAVPRAYPAVRTLPSAPTPASAGCPRAGTSPQDRAAATAWPCARAGVTHASYHPEHIALIGRGPQRRCRPFLAQ